MAAREIRKPSLISKTGLKPQRSRPFLFASAGPGPEGTLVGTGVSEGPIFHPHPHPPPPTPLQFSAQCEREDPPGAGGGDGGLPGSGLTRLVLPPWKACYFSEKRPARWRLSEMTATMGPIGTLSLALSPDDTVESRRLRRVRRHGCSRSAFQQQRAAWDLGCASAEPGSLCSITARPARADTEAVRWLHYWGTSLYNRRQL